MEFEKEVRAGYRRGGTAGSIPSGSRNLSLNGIELVVDMVLQAYPALSQKSPGVVFAEGKDGLKYRGGFASADETGEGEEGLTPVHNDGCRR